MSDQQEQTYEIPVTDGLQVRQPAPHEQLVRFGMAVCERLGVDPAVVDPRVDFHCNSDDEFGQITLKMYLPREEIIAMWNGAKKP